MCFVQNSHKNLTCLRIQSKPGVKKETLGSGTVKANERKIGISAAFLETGSFGQSQHKTVHLCNDGSPSTASVVLTFLCDSDASGSQTGLVIRIIWSDFVKHGFLMFITGLLNQNSGNKSSANDPEVVSWVLLIWWSSGIDI